MRQFIQCGLHAGGNPISILNGGIKRSGFEFMADFICACIRITKDWRSFVILNACNRLQHAAAPPPPAVTYIEAVPSHPNAAVAAAARFGEA